MHKFLLIVGMLLMPIATSANDEAIKEPLSIVIVDTQKLMSESKAAKSIQKQGVALRKKYQGKIEGIEQNLKKSEKSLIKASKGKNRDDFLKKQKAFQDEILESKKKVAELNQKMDKAIGSALKKLKDEIIDVVEDIADDNEYDMVLSNTNVLVVSEKIDITSDVMNALNKEISTISVRD
jgi:outer membrane protein